MWMREVPLCLSSSSRRWFFWWTNWLFIMRFQFWFILDCSPLWCAIHMQYGMSKDDFLPNLTQTCNMTEHHRTKRTNGVDSPLYSWSISIGILSFPHHFGYRVLHLLYWVLLVWPLLLPLYSHWYQEHCNYQHQNHHHRFCLYHHTQPNQLTESKQSLLTFRTSSKCRCVCWLVTPILGVVKFVAVFR